MTSMEFSPVNDETSEIAFEKKEEYPIAESERTKVVVNTTRKK